MIAAAFWVIKINRTWDTWVGTERNRGGSGGNSVRIPSIEKGRCQRLPLLWSCRRLHAARLRQLPQPLTVTRLAAPRPRRAVAATSTAKECWCFTYVFH